MEKNKTFCVIEDNTPNRKLFAMLIKKSGYNVVDFENAATSLNWLNANYADLIIVDILLPDMNGSELLKEIKQMPHLKNSVVIAITGFSSSQDRDKFLAMGFDGYISKPINTATFIADLEQFLK
ncbi:MAG: response regulator [Chloroherpetonaceae bacterium]|jgi:CheY-like chemotaxis protein|nr:response regulator [bacterium]HAW09264.1 response regulator [Bacteroidota bacterium]